MRTIADRLAARFKWRRSWGVEKTVRGTMLFLMACRGMTRKEIAAEIGCNDQELGRFLRKHNAEIERPGLLLDAACVVHPYHLMFWKAQDICAYYNITPSDVYHGRTYRRIRTEEPWWTIVASNLLATASLPKS